MASSALGRYPLPEGENVIGMVTPKILHGTPLAPQSCGLVFRTPPRVSPGTRRADDLPFIAVFIEPVERDADAAIVAKIATLAAADRAYLQRRLRHAYGPVFITNCTVASMMSSSSSS